MCYISMIYTENCPVPISSCNFLPAGGQVLSLTARMGAMAGLSPPWIRQCNQDPLMVNDKDGRPKECLLVVECFCIRRWCTVRRSVLR